MNKRKFEHHLGQMYFNGDGLPQDYAEAVRWFRRAAEQGFTEAQYNLGQMYNNGQSVPQDYAAAGLLDLDEACER